MGCGGPVFGKNGLTGSRAFLPKFHPIRHPPNPEYLMSDLAAVKHYLTRLDVDGNPYDVTVRMAYDGIEYIGRLWFAPSGQGNGIPDHGALPGKTVEEVMAFAQRLGTDDLVKRFHRAHAEKRRYLALRRATDEILSNIKYMNKVAVSMKLGMIDKEGGTQELDLIEKQLTEVVSQLRGFAGVEG